MDMTSGEWIDELIEKIRNKPTPLTAADYDHIAIREVVKEEHAKRVNLEASLKKSEAYIFWLTILASGLFLLVVICLGRNS